MKFAAVVLAVLAVAAPLNAFTIPVFGQGPLYNDVREFVDMVPIDKVAAIVLEYLAEDKETQTAFEYLQSDEFKALVKDVEAIPEVRELMNYIEKAGIHIYQIVNQLNEYLGLEAIKQRLVPYKITGGVAGLVKDIKAVLPLDKLEALYKKKLETSKAFQDFVAQLKSPNAQQIVNKVVANQHFKDLVEKAKKAGIDLDALKELIHTLFGLIIPPINLGHAL